MIIWYLISKKRIKNNNIKISYINGHIIIGKRLDSFKRC
jgi:hypothetical protein